MALDLGTLYGDIDLDTDPLKAAEKETANSLNRIENNFDGLDRKTAKTAKSFGQKVKAIGSDTRNLGFQIQDFIIQVQAGQSPFIAFSQQSGQLLQNTMPLVALFSVLAGVLGSTFVPGLFDSENAADKLKETLKALGDIAVETENDIIVLTEEIAKLAKESEQAALTQIRGGIVSGLEAIGAASTAAAESLDKELGVATDNVSGRMKRGLESRLERVAEKFGITREELERVRESFNEFDKDRNADTLQNVQDVLDSIAATNQSASDEFIKLANSTREYSSAATDAQEKVDKLREIQQNLNAAVAESDKAFEKGGMSQSAIDSRLKALENLGETERDKVLRIEQERRAFVLEQDNLTAEARNGLLDKIAEDRESKMRSINQREMDADEKRTQQLIKAQQDRARQQISLINTTASAISNALSATGNDSAAQFASLLSQIASFATTITTIMQAQAQAQALGDPTAISVPQKLANQAIIAAQFAGLVATISSMGGGRQFGGTVSAQMAHPINEAGLPEILNQNGKQFLLPTGQGGTITPLDKAGGGAPNVTVVNNGTPQAVQGVTYDNNQLKIMMDDAKKQAINEVNTSLATGRGDTYQALQQGSRIQRNI